jgi:hypothetical protein
MIQKSSEQSQLWNGNCNEALWTDTTCDSGLQLRLTRNNSCAITQV